eukprot:5247759-Prymnesium_polylepis.1
MVTARVWHWQPRSRAGAPASVKEPFSRCAGRIELAKRSRFGRGPPCLQEGPVSVQGATRG